MIIFMEKILNLLRRFWSTFTVNNKKKCYISYSNCNVWSDYLCVYQRLNYSIRFISRIRDSNIKYQICLPRAHTVHRSISLHSLDSLLSAAWHFLQIMALINLLDTNFSLPYHSFDLMLILTCEKEDKYFFALWG